MIDGSSDRETGAFGTTDKSIVLGETDDLWLRPLVENDASQTYLRWLEESAMVFGAAHLPHDIDALRADITVRQSPPKDYLLGIFLLEAHIGNLSLHVNLRRRTAEVGILVGQDFRNRGVAKRAHALALDWAFHCLKLRKIWAGYLASNMQASALYSGLGFTREALLRRHELINETVYDVVRVGMLAQEWRTPG
jgi:ribosomal-protein-alanine N-acetyltransferase